MTTVSSRQPEPPHGASGTPSGARRASTVLRRLAEGWSAPRVSLHDLVQAMHDRAFGFLILALAVPNIVPHPVPGLSGVLGVPLVLICLQMTFGRAEPWLPRTVARRSVSADGFRRVVTKAMPRLEKLERLLHPRLQGLARGPALRVVGLACALLAVMLALPIPFGNTPTALALTVTALGLIERDGAYVLAGLSIGLATAIGFTVLGWGALAAWQAAGMPLPFLGGGS